MADSVLAYEGVEPHVVQIQEAAAGSANDFYIGDLVKATDGELVIATAQTILGIARKTATGTASTEIPVELLNINTIYTANYTASATAETLIGDILDFTFTAGAHYLSTGGTTDTYCVGLHPRDAVGTSGGRVLFRFHYGLFKGTA